MLPKIHMALCHSEMKRSKIELMAELLPELLLLCFRI
jgi:hypothetical protein